MEPLIQQHFGALILFGLAAFLLGMVARAVGDHLLGTKRQATAKLRDAMWRRLELEAELVTLHEQIELAPVDVRQGAFQRALEDARRWSAGMKQLAQRFGFGLEPPAAQVEEQAPNAWSAPPPWR